MVTVICKQEMPGICRSGCYVIIANVIMTSASLANETFEYIIYMLVMLACAKKVVKLCLI